MSLLPANDRILLGPGPSLTPPRVMRARIAASAAPSVTEGSTKCASVPLPPTGSHPSCTANTIAISGPSQKFGIEIPTSDRVIAAKSIAVPRHTAAMIPSGRANSTATAIDANASSAVAGILSTIWRATG